MATVISPGYPLTRGDIIVIGKETNWIISPCYIGWSVAAEDYDGEEDTRCAARETVQACLDWISDFEEN